MNITNLEMLQVTLDYWKGYYPERVKKLGEARVMREAKACVKLTLKEMEAIMVIAPGMTRYEAWTEARNLFCFQPPPKK